MSDISLKIQKILDDNKLDDLNRFIKKRQCLNSANLYLNYIFHLLQSAGILTTAVASGYSVAYLVWLGIGLNIVATLIHIYEQTNNNISKRLLSNIEAIKNGTYVDEDVLVPTSSSDKKSGSVSADQMSINIGHDLENLLGNSTESPRS
jgi:hypothetical protein